MKAQEAIERQQQYEAVARQNEHFRKHQNQIKREHVRKYREEKARQIILEQEKQLLMMQERDELKNVINSLPAKTKRNIKRRFFNSNQSLDLSQFRSVRPFVFSHQPISENDEQVMSTQSMHHELQ